MKIKKILNNNSVLATDQDKEYVLIGKGIAYKCKPGDEVKRENVEKRFAMESVEEPKRLIQLVQEIPLEVITISNKIITFAEERLKKEFQSNVTIAITDHVNFALKRAEEGAFFKNYLLWEIKRFYPDEYKVALESVRIINESFQKNLPEEEASFLALHFINGDIGNMSDTIAATNLIKEILAIIQYYFKIELDENSLNYYRFVIHLKFFAGRIVSKTLFGEEKYFLYDLMCTKYSRIKKCVDKIELLITKNFGLSISQEEKTYLMLHIERVLSR